jgi:hypothetical protein
LGKSTKNDLRSSFFNTIISHYLGCAGGARVRAPRPGRYLVVMSLPAQPRVGGAPCCAGRAAGKAAARKKMTDQAGQYLLLV